MSETFKGIVYLSEQQYREKYNAQTLDVNTLYMTPDSGSSGGGQETIDAYTKEETDELLTGYLPIDNTSTGKYRVYGIQSDGQQIKLNVTTSAGTTIAGYIATYFGSSTGDTEPVGRLISNTPLNDYHVANKKYVDEKSIPVRNFIEV